MTSRQEDGKVAEEIPDKCPNCGKKGTFVRDEESGEMVCSNCGFVLREREEEKGPAFSSSEAGNPEVASGPPTSISQPDMGLETVIGRTGRDASGGALTPRMRTTVDRMRVWDRRSKANQSAYRSLSRPSTRSRPSLRSSPSGKGRWIAPRTSTGRRSRSASLGGGR